MVNDCVPKVVIFIAPKLLGGKESITPISGIGFNRMAESVQLTNITVRRLGEDICITGDVQGI
ncbi:dihydrofolate reductase family protein [Hazenella sp. IB182357]|uniref:Dihydrofolate reductase family protein n=1 Tax=Polycladospora coralii TaxID=2771432 RepID=A0A926N9J5_9BACL|nr:dihydrofolate reductase family protein [Polycladospora coralii]MBD1371000.1 dihydrofolate reductase family protein [Polycladospora coralii]MBS7529939.1 dihydrofolate reductase family protein [Polycladospora coralii]